MAIRIRKRQLLLIFVLLGTGIIAMHFHERRLLRCVFHNDGRWLRYFQKVRIHTSDSIQAFYFCILFKHFCLSYKSLYLHNVAERKFTNVPNKCIGKKYRCVYRFRKDFISLTICYSNELAIPIKDIKVLV